MESSFKKSSTYGADPEILVNGRLAVTRIQILLKTIRFGSWASWLFIFWMGSTLFTLPVLNTFFISISFCAITASGFVINQYFDKTTDRLNPRKKNLPIASGKISYRNTLILLFSLISLSFAIPFLVDMSVLPFLLMYLTLGLAYSANPLKLKKRPIIDLLVAGACFGVLPFLIGMQVVYPLTMDFSNFVIVRRYIDAALCALPIFLFQVSGHLYQAIGDYEADKESGITTFVVRYGKEKSAKIGATLFLFAAIIPIFYGSLGLPIMSEFTSWYLLIFLIFLPATIYFLNLFINPKENNLERISRIPFKFAPFLLIIMYFCIFILRIIIK